MKKVICIALGANLPHPVLGPPEATLEAAINALDRCGLKVVARSNWYRTAPVPVSDQPWFVNGVVCVETPLGARDILAILHDIEAEFGRVRGKRWEARVLDLDLIAYGDEVIEAETGPGPDSDPDSDGVVNGGEAGIILPHPRMQERAFVLAPMAEVAPHWRHPVLGKTVSELLRELEGGQEIARA